MGVTLICINVLDLMQNKRKNYAFKKNFAYQKLI